MQIDLRGLAALPAPRHERDTVEHHMMMALLGHDRRVIEIGFRHGTSAKAFLFGGCASLTSFDISDCGGWPARIPFKNFEFVQRDSQIGPRAGDWCDVLFIDGHHDYHAALSDLELWSPCARERILVHDTHGKQPGPREALSTWLSRTASWHVEADFKNCYGMTVLCR